MGSNKEDYFISNEECKLLQLKLKLELARDELNSLYEISGSLLSPALLKSTRKFDKLHIKFLRATNLDVNKNKARSSAKTVVF